MFARLRFWAAVWCSVVGFCLVADVACAQRGMPGIPGLGGLGRRTDRDARRQQQQQQPQQQLQKLPALQATGTVEAVVPGYIKVLSNTNQVWVLQVLPNARCQLTGKAKPEFLSPGLYVRFVAEVNKRRGTVDQKITKLTVFTPSTFRQPGAEPDLGLGTSFGERPGAEKDKQAEQPAKPAFGAGALAGPGPAAGGPQTKRAGSSAGAKAGGPELFDIRGQITSISHGKATLQVPNVYFKPMLRIEIAEDADIDVELDDPDGYTLARKGDKIQVRGYQGLGNQGLASDLQIDLVEPLGAPQESKKPPSRTGRAKRGVPAPEMVGGEPAEGESGQKASDAEGRRQDQKPDSRKVRQPAPQKKPVSADSEPGLSPEKAEPGNPEKAEPGK